MYDSLDLKSYYVSLLILQAMAGAGFSTFVAVEKNRSAIAWFLLGLFFSLFALLAVGLAPARQTVTSKLKDGGEPWNCPKCGVQNIPTVFKCQSCDYSLIE